jgi:hypothetical protein
MRNRITHILKDWEAPEKPPAPAPELPSGYALPRGINMLTPVELCINRDLLVTILTASIDEIYRHRRLHPAPESREMSEIEAALQQQLLFREWAKGHPSNYICIAMYPVLEYETVEDPEDDLDL